MKAGVNASNGDKKVDHAGVVAPPPLIFLFSILIGLGFNTLWAGGDFSPGSRVSCWDVYRRRRCCDICLFGAEIYKS